MTSHPRRAKRAVRLVRRMAWLYFALLLVEGALRKWVLPGLSQPIYLVRDPVVLVMYVVALRGGIFPNDVFTRAIGVLAVLFGAAGLLSALGGPRPGMPENTLPVILHGLKSNFLHLPLIFLLPRVFRPRDVRLCGKIVLVAMVPVAALMVMQFQMPPQHWLNAGPGGVQSQMQVISGVVRPAGPFSFNTEMRYFLPMALAFVLYGMLRRGTYSLGWVLAAGIAFVPALAVSGNRGALGGALVVLGALTVVVVIRIHLLPRLVPGAAVAGVLLVALLATPFVERGMSTLEARLRAGGVPDASTMATSPRDPTLVDHFYRGVVLRFVHWFEQPFLVVGEEEVPWLGYGLGMGSPAGARLLGRAGDYILAHDEWPRIVMESGPILGMLFILFRCVLGVWLGLKALRACIRGAPLALLLFGAFGIWILMGALGRAPTAGLVAWGGGLTLAACHLPAVDQSGDETT